MRVLWQCCIQGLEAGEHGVITPTLSFCSLVKRLARQCSKMSLLALSHLCSSTLSVDNPHVLQA